MCRKIVTFFYQWALVISSILSQSVYAQEGNTHGLYLQSKGGFLMAHRSAMAHLVRNNALGLEVGYVKYKQAYEDRFYRFPSLGFNLEFRNFGYSKVLGSAVSLSHFFGRSIYQSNSFFVDFQYGMGVGYITKKYDLATNPTNNAIGSHFNAKVTLKLMATKNFNSFTLGGGLELSHFSNGAITYPNLGLNLPSVCIQVGLLNNVRMNYHSQNWDGIDLLEKREKNLLISAVGAIKQVRANPNLPK
ncbi:MAG: acyloxyacyl hydrolase, partial [Putridiphycobacter sp.]|nr:acyloxyacyl hydrolase [Putridiphycobacter sp.]